MSDDTRYDEIIDREAKGYRVLAVPPAEAMWARIEGDVADAVQRRPRLSRQLPWLVAGAGIAAALVIGVVIGRRSIQPETRPAAVASSVPATPVDSAHEAALRAMTMGHLVQAEVFLTEVRTDLTTGRRDPRRAERSRHLLTRTRLLMANDGGHAPSIDRLLQDLELVLAEIAALPDSGARRTVDAHLLDERLRVGTVLPRIRTIVPASPVTGGP